MDAKLVLTGEKPKIGFQHRRFEKWAKKHNLKVKLLKDSVAFEGEKTTLDVLKHHLTNWCKTNDVKMELVVADATITK